MISAGRICRPVEQIESVFQPAGKERCILVARREEQFCCAESAPVTGAAASHRDATRPDCGEGEQIFPIDLFDPGIFDSVSFAGLFRHQAALVIGSESPAAIRAPGDQQAGHGSQIKSPVPHKTARFNFANAGIIFAYPDDGDGSVFRQNRGARKPASGIGRSATRNSRPIFPSNRNAPGFSTQVTSKSGRDGIRSRGVSSGLPAKRETEIFMIASIVYPNCSDKNHLNPDNHQI